MKKIKSFFYPVSILLLGLFFLIHFTAPLFAANQEDNTDKRYIVVLKKTAGSPKDIANEMAQQHMFKVKHVYQNVLKGYAATLTKDKLDKVKQDPRVEYVTEDTVFTADLNTRAKRPTKPSPTPTATKTPTPTPTSTDNLYVKVTAPNGGEILQVGQTYKITWDSSANIDKVSIGYSSCDSCLDWIAYNYPNTGSYDWTVNVGNTTNTQFKIDITAYYTGVGSTNDRSDNYFTVLSQPTPTADPISEYPNGVKRTDAQSLTNKGQGVAVAVIDTGIQLNHPDLAGNIIANTNCVTPGSTGNDDNGHGTHVAGTIAAIQNGQGVVGMASSAKLVAVKVLNSRGSGYMSDIICGIDYVTSQANNLNIKVANMSLGGTGSSDNNCGMSNNDPMHQAICNSRNAGVTYVVAAGNETADTNTKVPAGYNDTVITVSALADSDGKPYGQGSSTGYGNDDTFASFSNYGSAVDIGAPGVSIYSTMPTNSYGYMSGTSMATPHVAGAAALYIVKYQGSSWTQIRDGLRSIGETLGNGHTDPSGKHPEPVLRVSSLN
jgi:hypothetical protein